MRISLKNCHLRFSRKTLRTGYPVAVWILCISIPSPAQPIPPTDSKATALSSGRILLEWESGSDAYGFLVNRSSGGVFQTLDTLDQESRSYVDSRREPHTVYNYYLVAFNPAGNSVSSDTLTVTTPASRTYYIDSEAGNDSGTGTHPDSAWKTLDILNATIFDPGDSVLLKSGSLWTGQIFLKGSGTDLYPVTLSAYGTGTRPRIDGGGAEGAVITLKGLSHWEVSDLEITNPAANEGNRLGVLITATGGVHGHIRLNNLYIHDILGRFTFQMAGKNTGGIGIIGEGDTRFDDLLIENCEISDIVRVGIFTNGNTGIRGDRPITNLVIRNNTVSRCAGDGMIIRYAQGPLIEHNLAESNHNGPESEVEYGVAIWVRSTDEAIIQYNRVFGTKGSMDGQAFDADLEAYRTVVQYNFSRDNEGGFMLVYGSSQDAIVRYNISQNDGLKGKHLLDFPVWVNPRGSGIFHNNVFYIGEGIEAVLVDEALPTARLYNNIVINKGGGQLAVLSDGKTAEFKNNCLVGYVPEELALNQQAVEGDPELMDPGNGGSEFTSLEGYTLSDESPCLISGIPVSLMDGSYWLDGSIADFWGNPVNQFIPDVGVYQLSTVTVAASPAGNRPGELTWEVVPVPFKKEFLLRVNAPLQMDVHLDLYDVNGRYVDTLYTGHLAPGFHSLAVDVSRPGGSAIVPGVYMLQLSSSEASLHESRMIICS